MRSLLDRPLAAAIRAVAIRVAADGTIPARMIDGHRRTTGTAGTGIRAEPVSTRTLTSAETTSAFAGEKHATSSAEWVTRSRPFGPSAAPAQASSMIATSLVREPESMATLPTCGQCPCSRSRDTPGTTGSHRFAFIEAFNRWGRRRRLQLVGARSYSKFPVQTTRASIPIELTPLLLLSTLREKAVLSPSNPSTNSTGAEHRLLESRR